VSLLFLSKLLPVFVYPLGLAIFIGLATLILLLFRFYRTAAALLALSLALLWLGSTPLFANWLFSRLETEYPAVSIEGLPKADVVIVLGGILGQPTPPREAPVASPTYDRLLQTARIYRAGKVNAVLVSGGNLPWTGGYEPESVLIADLLVELGVPRDAIVLDTESANTHENAVNSAAIMHQRNWRTALLVTSGAHMPRAMATFRRAGVNPIAAPADVEVTDPSFETLLDLMPDSGALHRTTGALKEYLGFLAYRVFGWA
jgi:uncharacterized SAM-binding protein YcdF (DUF218 family)